MQNSKYSKVLTIVLIIIVVLIIGLLIFWGISAINRGKVDRNPDPMANLNEIGTPTPTPTPKNNKNTLRNDIDFNNIPSLDLDPTPTPAGDNTGNGNNNNKQELFEGYVVLGYIEIPKTKIKYPILEKATKQALEKSVCYFYGPGLNEVGNTTIVGHNYRNGKFFSDNEKLSQGDEIYITDANKNRVKYTIYRKYETTPEDASFVTRDTAGAREISLSTCTDDSQARTIIYAKAEN